MNLRIGVDIGGTFTDLALVDDDTGRVHTHKLLTTPAQPEHAVVDGVRAILALCGGAIRDVKAVVHGTTLVTNAVIERRGCRVGMLVTRGFRDRIDMARETRYDLYDLRLQFAPSLAEPGARIEVRERIGHDGSVLLPLCTDGLGDEIDRLVEQQKVEALAVCLLHSHVDAGHERKLRELIQCRHPHIFVSLSGEGYPVVRVFDRWTTSTLNADVQPLVDRYLRRLESGLAAIGFAGHLRIMASNGGTLTPEVARRYPSRLLESGPAAGILMSSFVGRVIGVPDLLAFDMGGTTAKGALVRNGMPLKKYELEVAHVHHYRRGSGLTINVPVLDMIEIGSGGGSLVDTDERGVLRVGPRSAGAVPGPACYGRGGTRATLTDANLALGYLDPGFFLGGRMAIDAAAADHAIVAAAGGLASSAARAAWGIHEVALENVSQAFRMHASAHGVDVRRYAMVAFGGSGPLLAGGIARKLGMKRVIFPPAAGVMSALGLLASPLSFEVARTQELPWGEVTEAVWAAAFDALQAEAAEVMQSSGIDASDCVVRGRLELRYAGQGYEISIDVAPDAPPAGAIARVPGQFDQAYRSVFGVSLDGPALEVVTWRLEMAAPTAHAARPHYASYGQAGATKKTARQAFDPKLGDYVPHQVYDRYRMRPGDRLDGPALVEEMESTIVVGSAMQAHIDEHHNLVMRVQP